MNRETVLGKRHRSDASSHRPFSTQKRDKYTVVACNECRKRKIKCSGDVPCRRCEGFELSCTYAQSYSEHGSHGTSTKDRVATLESEMSRLQSQVEQLSAALKQVEGAVQSLNGTPPAISTHLPSAHDLLQCSARSPKSCMRRQSIPTQPLFIGPTSSAYNFNVANNSLQMMGIQSTAPDSSIVPGSEITSRCESLEPLVQTEAQGGDPLLGIDINEIYRTLAVYKEELDPFYAFIPLEQVMERVPLIHEHAHHRHEGGCPCGNDNQYCSVDEKDINVLKLMVASALVLEGYGKSNLAQQLVDSVDSTFNADARRVDIDLKGLQVFTMMSIYHFQCDDSVLAWRTIGLAARIALELGLHRRESLEENFPDPQKRYWALRLFWCIYVLDRRWSFGTSLPFALQESDIDPDLPHLNNSEPYLECLVGYGKICSRVWSAVTNYDKTATDNDVVGYLDFQIQQWMQSIPHDLQLLHPRLGHAANGQPRALQRSRVLLYIRGNHMRIFVHRHNILSASNISQNLTGARLVTNIARDTITVLVHLRESSTIYDTQQSAFNYFLISAISAIFLAVCHAPAEFSHSCQNEFYSALGILKDLSGHSFSSKRLWKSIRGVKNVAPKLGLSPAGLDTQKSSEVNDGLNEPVVAEQSCASQHHDTLPRPRPNLGEGMIPDRSEPLLNEDSYNPGLSTSLAEELENMPTAASIPGSNEPDMFEMGSDLTNMFKAFGHHSGELHKPLDKINLWVANGLDDTVQNGNKISRLFGQLL